MTPFLLFVIPLLGAVLSSALVLVGLWGLAYPMGLVVGLWTAWTLYRDIS